jgi:hypothetical protein
MSQTIWVFIALAIVLCLIGAAAWLVRKFSSNSVGSAANRGRMPRLAVIDAAAVDGRRRLVLVRRDNVEHLIMIGGPTDVVVEPNIVRGAAQRDPAPQRAPAGTELPPRMAPLSDPEVWADNDPGRPEAVDVRELAPESVARIQRASYPDEIRRSDPRIERPAPRTEPRPLRTPAPARPAPPRAPEPQFTNEDQNLADMAQQLEAALRRPNNDIRHEQGDRREPRAPAMSQMDRVGAPPMAPEAAPRASARGAAAAKPQFNSLEDEMANLLGRPKNSS